MFLSHISVSLSHSLPLFKINKHPWVRVFFLKNQANKYTNNEVLFTSLGPGRTGFHCMMYEVQHFSSEYLYIVSKERVCGRDVHSGGCRLR